MKPQHLLGLLVLISVALLEACSSGKSAYEQGNYFESVMTSINRLRRNTDHKKSVETLQQAYPLAVQYFEGQANNAIASNQQFKWATVVQAYTSINVMHDEIKRSPGALAVVPNPVNYYAKLDEAKRNAAEEYYNAGILALQAGTRDKAKEAYYAFQRTNEFVSGYKDVNKMMETALAAATVKVLVTPVPVTRNVGVSADFFNDKISEFLHKTPISQFVKFYSQSEVQTLKLYPDHIVELQFDEFMVGQVTLHEKQIMLEKDSVVVGTYIAQATNSSSNTTGTTNQNSNTNTSTNSNANTNTSTNTNTGTNTNTSNTNTNTSNTNNTNTNTNTGNTNNQNTTTNPGNTSGNSDNQNTNTGNTDTKDEDKVTICHKPPGNTGNAQTLIIPRSALQAHLDHGDALGYCPEDTKDDKGKSTEKSNDNKKGSGSSGGNGSGADYGMLTPITNSTTLYASASTNTWMFNTIDQPLSDTTKIYAKVKATYYHFQKTTTSKGIVSFRILDAKTKAILSAEKMPGQYVWVSEWATFNGDERALSPLQLEIAKQRERVPPEKQDLFIEFTKPIYTQITTKIQNFYKGY